MNDPFVIAPRTNPRQFLDGMKIDVLKAVAEGCVEVMEHRAGRHRRPRRRIAAWATWRPEIYRLLAAVLLLTAWPAEAGNPLLPGVKGDDDRITVDSREYPWSTIGRLNKRTGGHCTGTLIGPKLVLSAAHCLWNPRTRRYLPPVSLHFVAGWSRGEYLAHSEAAEIIVPPDYRKGPSASPRRDRDWALVRLKEDVGKVTGYLGIEVLDREALERHLKAGTAFVQAGYSKDKRHVLTVHAACPMVGFAKGKDLLKHRCDAVPGDSGSPIFLFDGTGFRIAAIHVATTRSRRSTLGIAVPTATFAHKTGPRAPQTGAAPPVATVATLLKHLGFETIQAFEAAEGLPATGKATPRLLGLMIQTLRPPGP